MPDSLNRCATPTEPALQIVEARDQRGAEQPGRGERGGSRHRRAIEAIRASGQEVTVEDEGPYWKLRGRRDIHVDLTEVEEELGAPIPMSRWLVSMSSFVGYVETGEPHFTVRADRGDAIDRPTPG